MNCSKTRSLLTSRLDRELDLKIAREVDLHLSTCSACFDDYACLSQTRRLVSALPRIQPPADLALRIRVALSREAARGRVSAWEALRFRMENSFRAIMVPATAGLLSAVVFFGLIIGFFALPSNQKDVQPWYTPPELAAAPFGLNDHVTSDSVVVEAFVDAHGRVQDYRILAGPQDLHRDNPQLKNMMIFTVFRPATAFGQPTAGKAVLSFANINVRG